jgi:hypothetical protein
MFVGYRSVSAENWNASTATTPRRLDALAGLEGARETTPAVAVAREP